MDLSWQKYHEQSSHSLMPGNILATPDPRRKGLRSQVDLQPAGSNRERPLTSLCTVIALIRGARMRSIQAGL